MSDLISRQAAIDIVEFECGEWSGLAKTIAEEIKQLPSVLGTNLAEVGTDCISRQAAIDAADRADYTGLAVEDVKKVTDEVIKELKQLPSAQQEHIRINLNEPIKVKLTEWGKEIYYHQYDRVNRIAGREICKPKFPKEDENGYTEIQLWVFIELYGEHMGMTLPNVIEPLEIVYER